MVRERATKNDFSVEDLPHSIPPRLTKGNDGGEGRRGKEGSEITATTMIYSNIDISVYT